MRKILFILNYRGGTHLFLSFSNAGKAENVGSRNAFWLPTIPEKACPCESLLTVRHNMDVPARFECFSWFTHIGDWWGDLTSAKVPGPYALQTPVRYGPDEIQALPGDDWRVVHLVRDGRNQVSSTFKFHGGRETRKRKEDPHDYFKALCKGFRNRARMAIDCNSLLSNFKLVKFEHLFMDPIGTMKEMYAFIGLDLDEDFIGKAAGRARAGGWTGHSSFGSSGGMNQRWKDWAPWQVKAFKKIAGRELVELGYETSENW